MKKWIFRILLLLVVIVVVVAVAVGLSLDSVIKRSVETVGPMLTKVEMKLDSVSLSLLSGSGSLKGLLVGNPEGFKSPSAIRVGKASLSLEPRSILGDKVIIRSIQVQAPEITFETDLKQNNLSKILSNVEASTSGGEKPAAKPAEPSSPKEPTPEKQAKAERKLQVDDFLITGGKINVSLTALGGKSVTVPLPEIHLQGLGQGPEGITVAELTKRVLAAVEQEAVKASGSAVSDLSKQATGMVKDAAKTATDAASGLKGIGDIFKKK